MRAFPPLLTAAHAVGLKHLREPRDMCQGTWFARVQVPREWLPQDFDHVLCAISFI